MKTNHPNMETPMKIGHLTMNETLANTMRRTLADPTPLDDFDIDTRQEIIQRYMEYLARWEARKNQLHFTP